MFSYDLEVSGFEFRTIQGLGLKAESVQGTDFRVSGFQFGVQGLRLTFRALALLVSTLFWFWGVVLNPNTLNPRP